MRVVTLGEMREDGCEEVRVLPVGHGSVVQVACDGVSIVERWDEVPQSVSAYLKV